MLEKVLHKIQSQIDSLASTFELFIDETIHPSVNNCEQLQQQLTQLQETLAVYKYHKINKELSPSYSIHVKVSEQEIPKDDNEKSVIEIKETIQYEKHEIIEATDETIKAETSIPQKDIPPFVIGINDKFRFINELFIQNTSEYSVAIEQLNTLKSWNETEIYLNSLSGIYNWKENSEVVNYFYSIAKKRFN